MSLSRLIIPAFCLILIMGTFIPGVTSCRHNDDITGLDTLCFDRDILPIFSRSCWDPNPNPSALQCHNPSSSGGYNFADYYGVTNGGVTPYDPMKSRVYTVLSDVWSIESMMPPNQPVSTQNRSLIKVWIEWGAKPKSDNCP